VSNVKNFKEQGGNRWVIGGELEVLEGAKLTLQGLNLKPAQGQADSTASTIADLKKDFNLLLAALFEAGLMAADKSELLDALQFARELLSESIIGSDEGEYPEEAVDAFESSILNAETTALNQASTESQVIGAKEALLTAISTFEAAVISN